MKKAIAIVVLCVLLATMLVDGEKMDITPPGFRPTPIAFKVPAGWPQPVYDFGSNPLTKEGFELGRKLFYDGRLSKDGNFACASCHQQFAAFATYDHNFSHGFDNTLTDRNAPGLFNLAWQKEFMHDGGINHLDLQPLAPMTAKNEMGETLQAILDKLKADKDYRKMFKAAFGDEQINTQRLTRAISQFVVMLVSADSRYDKMKKGKVQFNLPESLGYEIFKQKCTGCHPEPLFTDLSYRNVGLPQDETIQDLGRMKITGDRGDSLKFKVPSLRNVALTFPYEHDGRFQSVIQVMEHYRSGVVGSTQTDPLVRKKLPISNFEIGQLIAFLNTLTDYAFVTDPRFADPGFTR